MLKYMLNPVFLISYVILCVIVALVGNNKRMGFWGSFLVSLVFTPVLVLFFMVIFQPAKRRVEEPARH